MLARLAHLIARRRWYVIGAGLVLTLFDRSCRRT